jgi:uncharacterized damage-inducible protein DinB
LGPIDVLADQWRRSCWSDAWHGSSLGALLRDVGAETAAAHPIVGGHSIWEVVLHLTGWTDEVARRLEGHAPAMPSAGDWPSTSEPTAARWQETLDGLAEAQARLERALVAFPAARLAERVGSERDAPLGTGVSHEGLVQGALQHNAYHGGQIALLRRAAGRL